MNKTHIKANIQFMIDWCLSVDPRPFMVIIGAFTATWGAWLMMPWVTTFENPIYETIGFFAPEEFWGAVLLVVGVGQIVHAFRKIDTGALIIALFATIIWTFIFVSFIISAYRTTAIPVYGQVVLYNAWLLYRVQGERVYGRSRNK